MARKSGITLKLEGFEDLLKDIEKANGDVNGAVKTCMKKSADIMQTELIGKMSSAGVDGDLIGRIPPPKVESEGNQTTAYVGYDKGAFDPKKPSDGYKIVFLNYGTPHRTKHGKVAARGFIAKAKKGARRKIKNEQERTLKEILEGLTK